jgi:molecular chaperone GrpE
MAAAPRKKGRSLWETARRARDIDMTTAKRRIPINHNNATAAATGADAPTPAPEEVEVGAPEQAGEPSPVSPADDPVLETEAVDEVAVLAAERDRLAAERDRLATERDALTDSLLRLRAEFDNFRKRMSRELIEARERAQGDLLGELLPVLDNLDRALDAAEHHEERKVLAGVRMTRDMFAELLRRSGVEEIETVGKPFDPTVHEALAVQPSSEEEGKVVAVVERGYRQGGRVLRPARVVVSAGLGAAASDRGMVSGTATAADAATASGTASASETAAVPEASASQND